MDTRIQHMMLRYSENNPGWGNLHIAMDDGNLEDSHIRWCIWNALDELDGDAAVIGNYLLKLSEEEREELYNRNW